MLLVVDQMELDPLHLRSSSLALVVDLACLALVVGLAYQALRWTSNTSWHWWWTAVFELGHVQQLGG